MHDKRPGPVPFLGHGRKAGVLLRDRDRCAEVVAEEHLVDIRPAGVDRRDRQQDQRHGDNPRTLVRVGAVAVRRVVPRLFGRTRGVRLCVPEALLAVEGQEQHPERVERGDEYADGHRELRVGVAGDGRQRRRLDDRVFGEEACERRHPAERQRTDQCRPVGDRHVIPQAAHLAQVLLVMQRDDHRTGGKEEQCLEESVRHQVEDRRRVRRHAERNGHVPQLREGRVGDDALDVGLDHAQKRHEQRGRRPDDRHERQRGLG